MALKFRRIDKCWQNACHHTETDVDFFLEENDWDDYGYQTSYHLHATKKRTGGEPVYLGALRIMRLDQTDQDVYLLSTLYGNRIFSQLPEDFVSLSMDIDLYMGLNRYLTTPEERTEIINALRLILGKESDFYSEELEENECFNNSLLRDRSTLDDFALQKGKSLLTGSECFYDLRKEKISVQYSHVSNEVELNFSCVDEDAPNIPNGILVFIGKNGSGKSTAIYKLAKLMYTDPTQRFRMKSKVGELKPNNVGVSKMFLISYSPFDNFVLPTSYDKDYIKLLQKGEDVNSRFVFCGIRKIEDELDDVIFNDESDKAQIENLMEDRRSRTSLKEISVLADEFASALYPIITDYDDRHQIWSQFIDICSVKQPSLFEDIERIVNAESQEHLKDIFLTLSTGHKFFLHSYARLLAYLDENSLLLFDEPENHLHPPLLSFLISAVRILLHKYKSVLFIATHSPVVLQETFADNVFVVRKLEGTSVISHPGIETYGANISAITSEVFDLTTGITVYHDAIRYLYKKWDMEYCKSIDQMLSEFETKLGHTLTDQVETYLINLYAQDNDVED